ncbi:MAG: TonB family protein [Proteobacteria bacterium]|nr:TonB family protein [Pseudomonadota bacterium]
MSLEHFKTQVLLLHSEQKILDLLSTGFNDRYAVHCATSGIEALQTLGQTPIHVIICAQDLPGMSGLDALREARKRSPDMIGILLAGTDSSDGLEALVGEQEVFKIIRGEINPDDLQALVEAATKRVRMMTIAESANDTAADVDVFSSERQIPTGEHIVMETAANGSAIISDGTGTLPALKPERIQVSPNQRGRDIDILVLSKDDEFLATIKESSLGLHDVHHAHTPTQAEEIVRQHKIGVLVTDAAMVGSNIEVLTQRLRVTIPRLVAIVAGRRDDGELLMDLINRGQVYRFLLKPVSPGRVRLAIEASVKHHLDAAASAFKGTPRTAASPIVKRALTQAPAKRPTSSKTPKPGKGQQKATSPSARSTQQSKAQRSGPMRAPVRNSSLSGSSNLDAAFNDGKNFTGTMTDIAIAVGKSISGASSSISNGAKSVVESSTRAISGIAELLMKPKVLAGAAGVAVVAIAATWMLSGDSDEVLDAVSQQPQTAVTAPVVEDVDDGLSQAAAIAVENTLPLSSDFLQQARDAREAGIMVSPAGANAMEFYVAALAAAPDDEVIAAELNTLTLEVFAIAESALLANSATEAARALRVIGMADPESPRLTFLHVQLEQLQLRELLKQARLATSEARFEDAGQLLLLAEPLAETNRSELDALAGQLAAARNEQRIEVEIDRKITVEQAEAEQLARADAAAKRAETERLATEQAEAAAAAQVEADRVAAEVAATEQVEADRVAAEVAAAEQVEADRVAAEVAAAAQVEAELAAAKPSPVTISAVKRIHYVAPKYPRAAQRRDISGWVDLAFTVTTAGDVTRVEITATEPETIFNASATRAVEQWLFEPATEDGQAVEKRVVMRLSFNLE